MKKFIAIILITAAALLTTACESSISGRYNISSMSEEGFELNHADLSLSGLDESYLNIDGDEITLSIAGDGIYYLTLDEENQIFIDEEDSKNNANYEFSEDGEMVTLSNPLDSTTIVFVLEDSALWEDILLEEGNLDKIVDDIISDNQESKPPESSESLPPVSGDDSDEFISTTTKLNLDSVWYGFMDIMNYEGTDDISGLYDVYGFIGNDGINDYFEIYLEPSNTDVAPIVTFYIDLEETFFIPIIDGNAFTFGIPLNEDDIFGYSAFLDNGYLFLFDDFESDTESFEVAFGFREYGSVWDVGNEFIPLGYEQYISNLAASA